MIYFSTIMIGSYTILGGMYPDKEMDFNCDKLGVSSIYLPLDDYTSCMLFPHLRWIDTPLIPLMP